MPKCKIKEKTRLKCKKKVKNHTEDAFNIPPRILGPTNSTKRGLDAKREQHLHFQVEFERKIRLHVLYPIRSGNEIFRRKFSSSKIYFRRKFRRKPKIKS